MTRTRQRNPRTRALSDLRLLKQRLELMISAWRVTSKVFVPAGERPQRWAEPFRPRRPDEYPEYSRDEWVRLARHLESTAVEAAELAKFARERAAELVCRGGCGRTVPVSEFRAGFRWCEHCQPLRATLVSRLNAAAGQPPAPATGGQP